MKQVNDNYQAREFWASENLTYVKPNFRLRKCAALLNRMARGRTSDLLDLGCGPATLRSLLEPNFRYHGMDIALHAQGPELRELDFVRNPIAFGDKRFDIVVALGVFEYMGSHHREKFIEIKRLLKPDGMFVMSYLNFDHVRKSVLPVYTNVESIEELTRSLGQVFRVEKRFPVSHHWRHKQPGKRALPKLQMRLNHNIPLVSSKLAVEYFFICSAS